MTVSEKLRLVQGLHSHAAIFGFNWNDDSDWTWHDVACKIADEIDAENNRLETENKQLRELIRYMWYADYAGHFSTLPNHQEHQAIVWQRIHELGIMD